MEDGDLQAWGEQLSKEVAGELALGRSKKWRCPRELRSRIMSYARVCRERGEPYLDIAVRLGLVESTLTRWFRTDAGKGRAGFRSVSIVSSSGDDTVSQTASSDISLITPHGYRVEGLDAQSVAYLLRVLG